MVRSSVVVVIPCYNESETIGGIVSVAGAYADVIVVDDGSKDQSASIASKAGARVIDTSGRVGYDTAINIGLAMALKSGYSLTITMDADGEHSPQAIPCFMKAQLASPCELVVGFRPRPQRLAEHMIGVYCKYRFGVKDIFCGMKAYGLPVLKYYFSKCTKNSINTLPALLWIATGAEFAQVFVPGRQRQGNPRFGSSVQANIEIMRVFNSIRRVC